MRLSLKALLPLISILSTLFCAPIPVHATQPAPQLFTLQTEHTLVTSNAQSGTLTVAISGAGGSVDVVHNLLSGTNESAPVTLSKTPVVLSYQGNSMTLSTGVTVSANGALLAWAGYNIRYLPCTNGLPTLKLARENGFTFTVTNPSPDSMWVIFSYDEGTTFTTPEAVGPHSGKAFANRPPAALAYVSHAPTLGPSVVCGNAGWKLAQLRDTAVARR
jgi:hypothetical protein